jgi:signal peptidase II
VTDTPRRRFGAIGLVAVLVIVLDQLTKWWAVNALQDRVIPVVWTLQFNLAHNTGAAFSLGRGSDITRLLPLLVLGAVVFFIWQSRGEVRALGAVAMGMVLGGAIGNLIDRALRTNGGAFFSGGVVDFIDFQWWPVFNVADMGVVIGGLLLVATYLFVPADGSRRPSAADGRTDTDADNDTDSEDAR